MENQIIHKIREETLFAGIRKPVQSRRELIPRMEEVARICGDYAIGPLQNIFRFDTPVEGFDSEVGFEVSEPVNVGEVRTHTLRKLHFFSLTHHGPVETLRETKLKMLDHLNTTGLSSELEDVEIYHTFDPAEPDKNVIEAQWSYLAWPEIYQEQLTRVLGPELAGEIWVGGESITPFTGVDERVVWVAGSLERLKNHASPAQQFDILSRVALLRPVEDVNKHKEIYEKTGDIDAVIAHQDEQLKQTPTGGFIDPHWSDGKVLHLSKVARDRKAYDEAKTHDELRRAYCFCNLIRQAKMPQVDPIFCYRAAGWARQFWEPILGVEFETCTITHSILKGDAFCAWEYDMPDSVAKQ
jgi:hypothetical protein